MEQVRQPTYESEITSEINVDVSTIPDFMRDELADTVLQGFRSFMKQPGSRELLDARIAAKKATPLQTGA